MKLLFSNFLGSIQRCGSLRYRKRQRDARMDTHATYAECSMGGSTQALGQQAPTIKHKFVGRFVKQVSTMILPSVGSLNGNLIMISPSYN